MGRRTARNELSLETLQILLRHRYETDDLDFKQTIDLSGTEGKVKLAKDVLAMANSGGGHIIVGVEDKTFQVVGLPEDIAEHLRDGNTITEKLKKWCGPLVTVHAALHQIPGGDGQPVIVALLFVPPATRKAFAAHNAEYGDKNGKEQFEFRECDLYVRKSSASVKARDEADLKITARARNGAPKVLRKGADLRNPYDPVHKAKADMFKGREREIDQLLSNIENGVHTAVFGLQRMGKTSLVEYAVNEVLLHSSGPRGKVQYVKVDLHALSSGKARCGEFFALITETLVNEIKTGSYSHDRRHQAEVALREYQAFVASYRDANTHHCFPDFSRALQAIIRAAGKKVVLFFDEFSDWCKMIEENEARAADARASNHTPSFGELLIDIDFMKFFSSLLREESLNGKLVFVFAARPFMVEFDAQRGLHLFRLTSQIPLSYFDRKAATALITEPLQGVVSYGARAVDYLYEMTAGHPFLIQYILKTLIDHLKTRAERTVTVDDIREAEEVMISQGAFRPQFEVLRRDYGFAEVAEPASAKAGKAILAVVAKQGAETEGRWVSDSLIYEALKKKGVPEEKVTVLLDQLVHAMVLEEADAAGSMRYRIAILMFRKWCLRHSLYIKDYVKARF